MRKKFPPPHWLAQLVSSLHVWFQVADRPSEMNVNVNFWVFKKTWEKCHQHLADSVHKGGQKWKFVNLLSLKKSLHSHLQN